RLVGSRQLEPGFMHQGGRLQSLPRRFLGQFGRGELAQLIVNQGQQLFGRTGIALFQRLQNARDVIHGASAPTPTPCSSAVRGELRASPDRPRRLRRYRILLRVTTTGNSRPRKVKGGNLKVKYLPSNGEVLTTWMFLRPPDVAMTVGRRRLACPARARATIHQKAMLRAGSGAGPESAGITCGSGPGRNSAYRARTGRRSTGGRQSRRPA